MKHNPNRLTETDLNRIVNKVIKESNEESLDEGIFSNIKNKYRGLKGMKRGYGMDYFENMSKLENLIKRLKKLDAPNEKVMIELEGLKNKVSSLGMPPERQRAITQLIDNSLTYFRNYTRINDQILAQISSLNLDSWK